MAPDDPKFEELRRRIARLRRRLDRSSHRLIDGSLGWLAWRGPVARYPGRALAAAVALGFVMATAARRIEWPRRFGERFYKFAIQGSWRQLWALVRRVRWRRSPSSREASSE